MSRALVSSAVRYTQTTAKTSATSPTRSAQARAWTFYRTPEVRSFANWVSNAMSGVRLYAGRRTDCGVIEPAPADHPAARIVSEIAGGQDGQAQLLREYGRHLAVAGEGWTVIQPSGADAPPTWHVISVMEIAKRGTALEATIGGQQVPIPAADDNQTGPDTAPVAIRVWDPSPEKHIEADSPVLAALDQLEELRLLSSVVRAITLSRLTGRGVLVVPKGTQFPTAGAQGEEDDLIDVFMQVAETAIRDPESAAATVPIILEVPAEMVGNIQRLTFESDFDELAIKLREENIRRFATAADIPAEFLLGLGSVNHWGAWTLTQEAIQLGIEPRAGVVAHAYTEHWLRPLLEAEGVPDSADWLIGVDTSPLRVRANRSETALQVFDRQAIGARALRRETGFDESDAPDAEELAARRTFDPTTTPGVELPVDESQSEPSSLPASAGGPLSEGILAAADGLIWAALSAAGRKLERTPACPRTQRARAREIEPAHLHTLLPVTPSQVEQWKLLDGAWARVPEIAIRYGLDPECLTATLDDYCRELIAAGVPHSYSQTTGVLRAPCLVLAS